MPADSASAARAHRPFMDRLSWWLGLGEVFQMHPIVTQDGDENVERVSAWQVARWLIAAVTALLLVTLFLTQATSTEAAAPVPSDDTIVYHDMAACASGDLACAVTACRNGNYN